MQILRDYPFVFLFVGLLVGSLGEYWGHRLLHRLGHGPHLDHHAENEGHGWVREFAGYMRRAIFIIYPVGRLIDYAYNGHSLLIHGPHFWYWIGGVVGHVAFTAYVHEAYHTNPSLVFWISRPTHYFHHAYNQRNCNFGWTVTWWDKLFGTYQDDPSWQTTPLPFWWFFTRVRAWW